MDRMAQTSRAHFCWVPLSVSPAKQALSKRWHRNQPLVERRSGHDGTRNVVSGSGGGRAIIQPWRPNYWSGG